MLSRYYLPGFLASERFDNEAAVAHYQGPVLIVHGENDEIVPLAQGAPAERRSRARARVWSLLTPDDHDVPWDWNTFAATPMQFYRETGLTREMSAAANAQTP